MQPGWHNWWFEKAYRSPNWYSLGTNHVEKKCTPFIKIIYNVQFCDFEIHDGMNLELYYQ